MGDEKRLPAAVLSGRRGFQTFFITLLERGTPVPHFRVTLAYDGTDFEGWQAQARGRTVQGVLEAALAQLSQGGRVAVAAAGRTDAGVHALGQVACFHLDRPLPPKELRRALNGLLPPDIRVLEASPAQAGFHARRSALSKIYRYELDTSGIQLPTRSRYAGHAPYVLDRQRVATVAALLVGRHDFASLASAGSNVKTSERTVLRSEVHWMGETLVYEVEAEGFLRKMVRSMVGGLLAAGRGTASVESLAQALDARERSAWPAPVEARGLVLVSVRYDEDRAR
jgi:tRNA pseudouridine38-40 synthase